MFSKAHIIVFRTVETDWKNLPRNLKEVLFAMFVKKMEPIYNLNLKEKQLMYSFIELHINLKNIVPADIKYANNKISAIAEISFDKSTRRFSVPSSAPQHKFPIIIIKKPASRLQNRFLRLLSLYVRN